MSMSTSPRPGRKTKKDKDKHSKKDRAKSAILSILPPVSHPISEQDFNDLASPTLLQISTKQSPTSSNSNLNEQPTSRPRTRSKFYTNQLFDEFEEPVTLTSTNQISPRCHTMSGGETRKGNGSDPSIRQPKISITTTTATSSDEENNNANDPSPSSSSSTDTAKEEIEKLRAEIHKLKIDKMDLIRQNVKLKEQKKSHVSRNKRGQIHQREIKKLNDKTQTNGDYRSLSLKHSYDPRKMYNATATTFAEFV